VAQTKACSPAVPAKASPAPGTSLGLASAQDLALRARTPAKQEDLTHQQRFQTGTLERRIPFLSAASRSLLPPASALPGTVIYANFNAAVAAAVSAEATLRLFGVRRRGQSMVTAGRGHGTHPTPPRPPLTASRSPQPARRADRH